MRTSAPPSICRMCDTGKQLNAGYLVCPHCDRACPPTQADAPCPLCEKINKRTR